jgi:hypothetical protein
MVNWWAKDNFPIGLAALLRDGSGKALLVFARASGDDWTQTVIADPDGPIQFAMMRPAHWSVGCQLGVPTSAAGRIGFSAWGDGTTQYVEDSPVDGLIWGDIADFHPRVAPIRDDSADRWQWVTGAGWWLRGSTKPARDVLYSIDFTASKQMWPVAVGGMASDWSSLPVVIGSDVVFIADDPYRSAVMAYDDLRGTHSLVSFGDDKTRGAMNVGTDGKDLVWTYGEGKQPLEHAYPTLSLMAAPYTTDPAALKPRRVRADQAVGGGESFIVGCGYAGHHGNPRRNDFIVRLADGAGWVLEGSEDGSVIWGDILGFTCSEVFVMLKDPVMSIVRIDLASLGPGLPPD